MKHIAHALAERRECLREAAGEWLDIGRAAPGREIGLKEYRAGFALMLLTAARVKAPLAKLLKLLALDWDWMNETYMKTLQATADAGTVAELLAVYPTLEWHERLFTGGVIEKCWCREHETAILHAARNEEEDDLRVALAVVLVLHGSPAAQSFAREVADEMPADPERRQIIELETLREVVAGRETPGTHRVLADMQRVIDRDRYRYTTPPGGRGLFPGMPTPFADPAADKVVPFGNTADMIGRNDPCPCGSGRKYKKCCME